MMAFWGERCKGEKKKVANVVRKTKKRKERMGKEKRRGRTRVKLCKIGKN